MPCITHETPAERAEAERRYQERLTGPLYKEIDTLKAELAERDAMLCAVLSIYNADGRAAVYAEINWAEAGVVQADIEAWWAGHQKKDKERRAREAAELEAKRAKVLKKLTMEERVLLGLEGKLA